MQDWLSDAGRNCRLLPAELRPVPSFSAREVRQSRAVERVKGSSAPSRHIRNLKLIRLEMKTMRQKSGLNPARVWAAVTVCLLALLPAAGAGKSPGATSRSCSSACYDRYYNCIVAGYSQSYCQWRYQYCLANCGTTP